MCPQGDKSTNFWRFAAKFKGVLQQNLEFCPLSIPRPLCMTILIVRNIVKTETSPVHQRQSACRPDQRVRISRQALIRAPESHYMDTAHPYCTFRAPTLKHRSTAAPLARNTDPFRPAISKEALRPSSRLSQICSG